jgi:hypothetical protein
MDDDEKGILPASYILIPLPIMLTYTVLSDEEAVVEDA